jgi:hypothetical protein
MPQTELDFALFERFFRVTFASALSPHIKLI